MPNRTTAQAKELLEKILYGEIDNISDALCSIRAKSDKDYIDACVKMFKYVLPEKRDITSNDKDITSVKIEVTDPRIGEELKKLLE